MLYQIILLSLDHDFTLTTLENWLHVSASVHDNLKRLCCSFHEGNGILLMVNHIKIEAVHWVSVEFATTSSSLLTWMNKGQCLGPKRFWYILKWQYQELTNGLQWHLSNQIVTMWRREGRLDFIKHPRIWPTRNIDWGRTKEKKGSGFRAPLGILSWSS